MNLAWFVLFIASLGWLFGVFCGYLFQKMWWHAVMVFAVTYIAYYTIPILRYAWWRFFAKKEEESA